MASDRYRYRWQFSLRSFLFVILIVGPVVGVVGPILLEAFTEWKPPPRPTQPQPRYHSAAGSAESESYYESGETPLY